MKYNRPYNVAAFQNCRTFVEHVVRGLRNVGAIESEDDEAFWEKMDNIRNEDHPKVKKLFIVSGLFGQTQEMDEVLRKMHQDPDEICKNPLPISFESEIFKKSV